MKRTLLLTLLLGAFALPSQAQIIAPIFFGKSAAGGGGAACTPASGYSHCRMLTIDHLQVPSTQTNFPVVARVSLGASRIQNSLCYDFIVTSDTSGATPIPWKSTHAIRVRAIYQSGFWWLRYRRQPTRNTAFTIRTRESARRRTLEATHGRVGRELQRGVA